jgi:hypothetical protein
MRKWATNNASATGKAIRLLLAALLAFAPFAYVSDVHAANKVDGDSVVVTLVVQDEVVDSDADGISDAAEQELNLDPDNADSDGDGMYDGWELWNALDPTDAGDATADPDGDAVDNLEEFYADASPFDVDTDGDGFWDGVEIDRDADPNSADSIPDTGVYGDVDRDGAVTVIDLQYVVNSVLQMTVPFPTNVNGTGNTDVIDLQEVVSVILAN